VGCHPRNNGDEDSWVYTVGEAMKSFEEIAKEAKVELTPEIRMFGCFVQRYALIDFWESAVKQAKYQHETFEKFLKSEEKL
jgi:hypothetical protein